MADDSISVLVVEDEPSSRRLIQTIVEGRGSRVEAVGDAESAWSAFQRSRHPLLVLDWMLPGMDGLEFCRRIRAMPDSEDVYILFVTGLDGTEHLNQALEAGASDFLSKAALADQIDVRLAIAERHVRRAIARRRLEAELARDALHDPITSLPNRQLFLERLHQAARRASRRGQPVFAVLIIDLHGFRDVNKTHGRDVGDRVLVEVARRLEQCIRGLDSAARLGGDDFAILLDGMKDVSDPTRVANRVHQVLSLPITIDGIQIGVSASIGMAISLTGYQDPEDLVLDAQKALMRAKSEGPGTQQMFDPVLHARAIARLRLEGRIRRAIEEEQLMLHFQPLVSLADGTLYGFEALVRWNDPDHGLVPPADFLPVAEETGAAVPLGWWVLRKALGHVKEWSQNGARRAPLAVSVNVSSRQFAQADMVERVQEILTQEGVQGSQLHLETTEAALMVDLESAGRTLRRLRDADIQLHVDDFGTGYSSLSYLCRFPIHTLKIDRSFVRQMTYSGENMEVVRTIVQLARNLGHGVIAEGVETEGQLALLQNLGCDLAQGYLISRPLDPVRAAALVKKRGSLL
jgi:diguanylate cyclase (GGDEF)-like protein